VLAGEWQVNVDGRRFAVDFLGQKIVLRFPRFLDVMWARHVEMPFLGREFLQRYSLEVETRFGSMLPVRIYPGPGIWVRILSSQVRLLNREIRA
jgi:hypothetical protein